MSNSNDNDERTDFVFDLVKRNHGIACANVKDGHIIVITKTALESFLKQVNERNDDKMVLFIKRTDSAT